MTKPKLLTYKVERWSQGSAIDALPVRRGGSPEQQARDLEAKETLLRDLRHDYGDEVADTVAGIAHAVDELRDQPSAADRNHTLQALIDDHDQAVLDDLDTDSVCELLRASHRHYRTVELGALSREQLAHCAREVQRRADRSAGAPSTDHLAVVLVQMLLALCPKGTDARARNELLHAALLACGLGNGVKTIERLLTKVKKVRG